MKKPKELSILYIYRRGVFLLVRLQKCSCCYGNGILCPITCLAWFLPLCVFFQRFLAEWMMRDLSDIKHRWDRYEIVMEFESLWAVCKSFLWGKCMQYFVCSTCVCLLHLKIMLFSFSIHSWNFSKPDIQVTHNHFYTATPGRVTQQHCRVTLEWKPDACSLCRDEAAPGFH